MCNHQIIYALLACILLSLKSNAQNNIPIDTIPFKLEADHRIYTFVSVNETDSLFFLIDTGASDMVINSERLNKVTMNFDGTTLNMGTTGSNTIQRSSHNLFRWGKQTVDTTAFIAIPYPNERWDGVLGLSVLRKYVVEINYNKRHIYLYNKEQYHNNNRARLMMMYIHHVPFVMIDLELSQQQTLSAIVELDTGSDRIIDLSTPFVDKHQLRKEAEQSFAISTINSSDGNSGTIRNIYFNQVKLADYELYRIPGGISEVKFGMLNDAMVDGMIGNCFLKRFNLIFDFGNDFLYFEPNNLLYTPFYDFLVQ